MMQGWENRDGNVEQSPPPVFSEERLRRSNFPAKLGSLGWIEYSKKRRPESKHQSKYIRSTLQISTSSSERISKTHVSRLVSKDTNNHHPFPLILRASDVCVRNQIDNHRSGNESNLSVTKSVVLSKAPQGLFQVSREPSRIRRWKAKGVSYASRLARAVYHRAFGRAILPSILRCPSIDAEETAARRICSRRTNGLYGVQLRHPRAPPFPSILPPLRIQLPIGASL